MLRRNGKPRSCEPCRISKVRCDHGEAPCQKCRSRRIASQCFYHPAPMTRPAGTQRRQLEHCRQNLRPSHPGSDTVERQDPPTFTAPQPSDITTIAAEITIPPGHVPANDTLSQRSSVTTWPTPPESTPTSTANSESTRSFFLGSTSYAGVFAEEGPIPASIQGHSEDFEQEAQSRKTDRPLGRLANRRFSQLRVARSIVSKLPPFPLVKSLCVAYFEAKTTSAVPEPLMMNAMPQLALDFQQLRSANESDSLTLYTNITRNTARPLKVPPDMLPSDFHKLFTGQNLRWETLGLFIVMAGQTAQFVPPDDPMFIQNGRKINRDEFVEETLQAGDECISLCREHGAVNDIVILLVYYSMLAISDLYGDNHHAVWRLLTECISALYAEGVHCESGNSEPSFLRDSRRRLYASIYRSDKTMSMFLGRPPLMACRYSDRKLPLDMDDGVAWADHQTVNAALEKLDEKGWNTEGEIYSASLMRLRYQVAILKEKVIEQSLAGVVDPDVAELQFLSTALSDTWARFPPHLRYNTYPSNTAWTTLNPLVTMRLVSAYLEYLHLEFQIARLLRRARGPDAIPELLDVSMRLLQTTLVFNTLRNQPYLIQRQIPTIILMYCVPSAGVLALELRRCTREGRALPGEVKKADVVRCLAVLISCLEWVVLPSDGNHRLCRELNKMLALVLDEVLNFEPGAAPAIEGTRGLESDGQTGALNDTETVGTSAVDDMGRGDAFFDFPLGDGIEPIPLESEDFLNWFDNANWNNLTLF